MTVHSDFRTCRWRRRVDGGRHAPSQAKSTQHFSRVVHKAVFLHRQVFPTRKCLWLQVHIPFRNKSSSFWLAAPSLPLAGTSFQILVRFPVIVCFFVLLPTHRFQVSQVTLYELGRLFYMLLAASLKVLIFPSSPWCCRTIHSRVRAFCPRYGLISISWLFWVRKIKSRRGCS